MKLLFLTLALTVTGFAETHRFEPTEFYNTFSGAHKPVLRIKPGDHVVTFTIDARGVDSAGVQRGQRSNPETGPFYIEGAEPGVSRNLPPDPSSRQNQARRESISSRMGDVLRSS